MKIVKFTVVFAIIAIIASLLSGSFFLLKCDWAGAVGIVATGLSVILSVVSIIYTYVSGNQTLDVINTIKAQNKEFIEKIKEDILKNNFNESNINDLLSDED